VKIIKIINQHRNDFTADIECEHCGHTEVLKRGYDDANYHNNVMPKKICGECKLDRNQHNFNEQLYMNRLAKIATLAAQAETALNIDIIKCIVSEIKDTANDT